jgi:hypothetical protein
MLTTPRFSACILAISVVLAVRSLSFAQAPLDDCNTNGTSDAVEIQDGALADCNRNRIPDICEIGHPPTIVSYAVTQAIATGFVTRSVVSSFVTPTQAAARLDLDSDGWTDLVACSHRSDRVVLLRNTGGSFAERGYLETPFRPECALAADVDGDGDADIVCDASRGSAGCFIPGMVSVWFNLGSTAGAWPTISARVDYEIGCEPEGMAAADVDTETAGN